MRSARNLAVWLCLALTLAGGLACGQSPVDASDLGRLDREIPRLPGGMSLAEVEGRLGSPQDVSRLASGEVAAHYQLWQLVFEPYLIIRERFYKAGYWPSGRPFAPLDSSIHQLRL